jgi:hypothetical protein
MKRSILGPVNLLIVLAGLLSLLVPITAEAQKPRQGTSENFYLNVRAGTCDVMNPMVGVVTSATPGTALIYGSPLPAPNNRMCVPVTGTDGQQLTLAEFNTVEGTANVKCVEKGTLVSIHLTGLQPGGTYSAWVPVTGGNVFPPALAATALGSVVGDDTFRNTFIASESGQGQLTLIQPEGIGTLQPGPIPACLLDMTFEIHIAYHIDGQTSGGVPGPATTWVVQERFLFPIL